MRNETNDQEEDSVRVRCGCCESRNVVLKQYPINQGETGYDKSRPLEMYVNLCDLCASTMTSVYDRRPAHSRDLVAVMKTVCYVGNEIIKAIYRINNEG